MNTGKIFTIAALLSLLSFFILPDCAQAIKYSGGSGTAAVPYKIGTAADLLTLAADTNDYNKYFLLTADINLASSGIFTTAVIAPDTNNTNEDFNGVAFKGGFDGGKHKIIALTIDSNGAGNFYLGLFGKISGGKIKNLGLENITVTGGNYSAYIGGLAGYSYKGNINDCCSTGSITGGNYAFCLGGLVGDSCDSNLSNSYSTAAVTGGDRSEYLGGLVGVGENRSVINNCYSTGPVSSGIRSDSLGGLVGYSHSSSINDCCSTSTVTGGNYSELLGGLVGYSHSSNISDCCLTGTVIGGGYSGALGGLAGYSYDSNISNCRSTDAVTGGSNSDSLGGLVGVNYDSNVSKCYSKGNVTGGDNSSCLGGLMGYNSSNSSIVKCYSKGNVTCANNPSFLGGLVGDNFLNCSINTCYSKGNVTGGNNSYCLGGLVGRNQISNVNDCYSTGDVNGEGNSSPIGGLVGYNCYDSNISNCYSAGLIAGGDNSAELGGLVGRNYDDISNCYSTGSITGGNNTSRLGGLVGYNSSVASIRNCYSAGVIAGGSGSSNLGGLAGTSSGGISSCYFLVTCGPANGHGKPLTDAQMKLQTSFINWDFVGETAHGTKDTWTIMRKNIDYPTLASLVDGPIQIIKCTVTAGSKDYTDAISFSGIMDATSDEISATSIIKVIIESNDIVKPCDQNFPVSSKTFKNDKYSYSGTDSNVTKSFTYDVNTHKFAFSASRVDLSGLSCPLTIRIKVVDYNVATEVDETIVNGPTTPIPIKLMMEVKDVLKVDKLPQVKHGTKPNTDLLSARGAFAVDDIDANMVSQNLVVTLGTQQFTIPKEKLKAGKGTFSCSNVAITGGIATASFNLNTCSFTLTIRNTNIDPVSGTVDFGIQFAGFNEKVPLVFP